ncbi:MAG: hypothetical protein QM754_21215 [Tepidisphaeraceae bacterium]
MDEIPDRRLHRPKLDGKMLADIAEIMSRDGRRAIVKLDDRKIENPVTLTAADLHAAHEIDISSFWVNPDHPHRGRRHFVYFLSGPNGTQYFGDSVSPEVGVVCEALDTYFGKTAPVPVASPASGDVVVKPSATWVPVQHWLFETRERFISALVLVGVLVAVLAFLAGRWSATPVVQSSAVPPPVPVSTEQP